MLSQRSLNKVPSSSSGPVRGGHSLGFLMSLSSVPIRNRPWRLHEDSCLEKQQWNYSISLKIVWLFDGAHGAGIPFWLMNTWWAQRFSEIFFAPLLSGIPLVYLNIALEIPEHWNSRLLFILVALVLSGWKLAVGLSWFILHSLYSWGFIFQKLSVARMRHNRKYWKKLQLLL